MNKIVNHDIVFSVDEDGNLLAQIEGVQGQGCDGLLDILAELGVVTHEEHTGDWDKPEPQGRAVRPAAGLNTGKAY